jgi:hypothetical protein
MQSTPLQPLRCCCRRRNHQLLGLNCSSAGSGHHLRGSLHGGKTPRGLFRARSSRGWGCCTPVHLPPATCRLWNRAPSLSAPLVLADVLNLLQLARFLQIAVCTALRSKPAVASLASPQTWLTQLTEWPARAAMSRSARSISSTLLSLSLITLQRC